jgi:polyisoprenoid-binding protein YceI
MKARLFSLVLTATLSLPAFAADWAYDPDHSSVGFKVRHMMVSDTMGAFDKVDAKVTLDDKDITKSAVEVTIDAASINTNNAKRDGHRKGADFFDVATHPQMTFKSTKDEKGSKPNTLKVTGDLTMRGVTKPVTLDVELTDVWQDPKEWGGNSHRGVKASGKLNRQDFGVKWQTKLDKGGVVVGDEVELTINAEFMQKAAAAK